MQRPLSRPKTVLIGVTLRRSPKRTKPMGGQRVKQRCPAMSRRRASARSVLLAIVLIQAPSIDQQVVTGCRCENKRRAHAAVRFQIEIIDQILEPLIVQNLQNT